LQLASIHTAIIYLSRPIAESSIVFTLTCKLLLAGIAEPDTASLDEGVHLGIAMRIPDLAVRPAKVGRVIGDNWSRLQEIPYGSGLINSAFRLSCPEISLSGKGFEEGYAAAHKGPNGAAVMSAAEAAPAPKRGPRRMPVQNWRSLCPPLCSL